MIQQMWMMHIQLRQNKESYHSYTKDILGISKIERLTL